MGKTVIMLGTVLAGGALALGGAGTAAADKPPNCSTADLAGVAAGVSAATSAYLFTHPDVNAFFSGLEGQQPDQIRTQVRSYLDANPQTAAEVRAIRQPMMDFRARCDIDPPESDPLP